MIDAETLEKLRQVSPQERIAVIEMLLHSLKTDITYSLPPDPTTQQRPTFGFMKDTGTILGDIIAPILPETAWEALQ